MVCRCSSSTAARGLTTTCSATTSTRSATTSTSCSSTSAPRPARQGAAGDVDRRAHGGRPRRAGGGDGLRRYATLGHSYGAFVVLQHPVDFAGEPSATIVSSGVPSARFLSAVEENLANFEPVELREQVTSSWAREAEAQTQEDCEALLHDQLPFHFADPRDPRIEEFERRTAGRRLRARRPAALRGRRLRRDRGRGPARLGQPSRARPRRPPRPHLRGRGRRGDRRRHPWRAARGLRGERATWRSRRRTRRT